MGSIRLWWLKNKMKWLAIPVEGISIDKGIAMYRKAKKNYEDALKSKGKS